LRKAERLTPTTRPAGRQIISRQKGIEMTYLTFTSTASRIVDRIDLVKEQVNYTAELLEANSQAIPADQLEKAREIIETLKALTEQLTDTTYQLLETL